MKNIKNRLEFISSNEVTSLIKEIRTWRFYTMAISSYKYTLVQEKEMKLIDDLARKLSAMSVSKYRLTDDFKNYVTSLVLVPGLTSEIERDVEDVVKTLELAENEEQAEALRKENNVEDELCDNNATLMSKIKESGRTFKQLVEYLGEGR